MGNFTQSPFPQWDQATIDATLGYCRTVTEEMHENFAKLFSFRADRVTSYAEWGDTAPRGTYLTAAQWWRKVACLKTVAQWSNNLERILTNTDHAHLLATEEFQDLSGDDMKLSLFRFLFDKVLTANFESRALKV